MLSWLFSQQINIPYLPSFVKVHAPDSWRKAIRLPLLGWIKVRGPGAGWVWNREQKGSYRERNNRWLNGVMEQGISRHQGMREMIDICSL
jgi:hypothetical protein